MVICAKSVITKCLVAVCGEASHPGVHGADALEERREARLYIGQCTSYHGYIYNKPEIQHMSQVQYVLLSSRQGFSVLYKMYHLHFSTNYHKALMPFTQSVYQHTF